MSESRTVAASVVPQPGPRVDFSYSFATPHRLTVARPDSSDKTLLDLEPGKLRMAWTYDDLTGMPIGAFRTPPTLWDVRIIPEVDGHPFASSHWARQEGYLPALVNTYEDVAAVVHLQVSGGTEAAIVRIRMQNTGVAPRRFSLRCDSAAWGENPAWVNPDENAGDCLLAGWNDRADRVLLLAIGADS